LIKSIIKILGKDHNINLELTYIEEFSEMDLRLGVYFSNQEFHQNIGIHILK
jgi:hypothetical protein